MRTATITILWRHKKYDGFFVGGYDYTKAGNRIFELTGLIDNKKKRIKFLEGIKQAEKQGWKKVKV